MYFEVVCINNKGIPSEIPISKHPKENEHYTVIEVAKLNASGGIYGYKLAEIDLSNCAPYLYFAASRFAILKPSPPIEKEEVELLVA